MKKKLFFCFILIFLLSVSDVVFSADTAEQKNSSAKEVAYEDLSNGINLKNKHFSIMLPEELRGFYKAKIKPDAIFLYDKASKKSGFGGFAFGVEAYKNPSEYAGGPGVRKIGELTDKKGTLYDMVLIQPTDVQFDYTKEKAPDSYKLLYDIGEYINITGIRGSIYHKNQGMKGKDLYNDILKKHIQAINEKWDSTKLENNNMSYMYNVLSKTNKNVLDKVGYAYYDVNGDGIEELFIGDISDWRHTIYDIYTMANRKPVHVTSGGSRNRYYVCDELFLCNEYSNGAKESGTNVYALVENSTELFPQVGFKYDGYENEKNPWFLSYNIEKDEWENVTKERYDERKAVFERYNVLNYTPLSKFKISE